MPMKLNQCRRQIDHWGVNIHMFVLRIIHFFLNHSRLTRIYEYLFSHYRSAGATDSNYPLIQSIRFILLGQPETPNKVKIEGDCSNFSAKLTWDIPSNNSDPGKYFIIEMATTTYDTEWRKNESDRIDPKLGEKTIKGLSPWTNYRFRVLAFNEIGKSDPSEPTELKDCKTPETGNSSLIRCWIGKTLSNTANAAS